MFSMPAHPSLHTFGSTLRSRMPLARYNCHVSRGGYLGDVDAPWYVTHQSDRCVILRGTEDECRELVAQLPMDC